MSDKEDGDKVFEIDKDIASFEEVLSQELRILNKLRTEGEPEPEPEPQSQESNDQKTVDDSKSASATYEKAFDRNLVGLAFSGGGIRSATINLGVIQGLARHGLLHRFDYLSTVSGGGYIGGWFSALLHRRFGKDENKKACVREADVKKYQLSLAPHPQSVGDEELQPTSGFRPAENTAVRYLRRYSNFLAPRLGLSGDMLAIVSIVLRNLIAMQLALVALVAFGVSAAHLLGTTPCWFTTTECWPASKGFEMAQLTWVTTSTLVVVTMVALGIAVVTVGRQLPIPAEARPPTDTSGRSSPGAPKDGDEGSDKPARRAGLIIAVGVIFPSFLAAWCISLAIVIRASGPDLSTSAALSSIVLAAMAYAVAWVVGYGIRRKGKQKETVKEKVHSIGLISRVFNIATFFIAPIVSGLVFGGLLVVAFRVVSSINANVMIAPWFAVAFGPPLFLLLLSFVVALHIVGARRLFSHRDREFLARLGGYLLAYSAAWLIVFGYVLYATPTVHWLAGGGLSLLLGWLGTSAAGAWIAKNSDAGAKGVTNMVKGAIARLTPWIFVAGIALLVTFLTQTLAFKFVMPGNYVAPSGVEFGVLVSQHVASLAAMPFSRSLILVVALGILFLSIIFVLDINLFSLHAMYCNRLGRAYLGASRAPHRDADLYTGFAAKDDLPLADLGRQRPIHIVNTAINSTGGDDLAWQTRRAAGFAFTPYWAGFEGRSSQGKSIGCYRPTDSYAGGRNLGTWLAVSGAAASPNMGYHTSAPVSALLTAFNLRLGRWCGNPDPKFKPAVWKDVSPRFAAVPVIAELTGSADLQSKWINLSDGGHFENLGVYELIRRRCKLIFVVDAGCDAGHKFDDLASMIRKCWVDFGVNVRMEDMSNLTLEKGSRISKQHFAIGEIQYGSNIPVGCADKDEDKKSVDKGKTQSGVFVYIKSSITGDEWPDIYQYAETHEDFPHQSTGDQFFDEDQFESYRHLGYKMLAHTVRELESMIKIDSKTLCSLAPEELVRKLLCHIKGQPDSGPGVDKPKPETTAEPAAGSDEADEEAKSD